MNSNNIIEKIFAITDKLLTDQPPQRLIDSYFFFNVWCDDWIQRVKEFRKRYWGKEKPPFSTGPKGERALLEWHNKFQAGRDPNKPEEWEDRKQFWGEIRQLATDYQLSEAAVQLYIQQGICPLLSSPSVVVTHYTGKQIKTKAVAGVVIDMGTDFAQISGDDLKKIWDRYRDEYQQKLSPSIPDKRRKQPLQRNETLIRAWTIKTLKKKAGLKQREAIKCWNERYPEFALDFQTENKQGGKVTQYGEIQISKDIRKLEMRLTKILPKY